jgi:hypothetical protein
MVISSGLTILQRLWCFETQHLRYVLDVDVEKVREY